MNWFLNLRVMHKLALCFGGCLVLAMLAGICALARMAQLDQASASIYADSVKGDNELIGITASLNQYRTWQVHYGSSKTDYELRECDSNLSQTASDTTRHIEMYSTRATDPADQANAKSLAVYWQAMQASTPDIARVCRGGGADRIESALQASSGPARSAAACLAEMTDWNARHAQGLVESAHDGYLSAQRIVILMLVLSVVVGVLLAWATAKVTVDSLAAMENHLKILDDGLTGLAANTDALAQGDFVLRDVKTIDPIKWDRKDEFGDLATTYDNMLMKAKRVFRGVIEAQKALTVLVGKVRYAAESIASSSSELSTGSEDLSQRTSEQASSLEETAASMEEMTSIVKQSAENARAANQLAAEARQVAQSGGEIVTQAVGSMNEINASSKRISDIIAVIDEIAFQTNLLALNAAVEAARVGEQGRGFAVVASEVRNLAGRSSTAAKEIKTLVQDSVRKVEGGSELVNKSGEQLKQIVEAVDKVAEIVDQISGASQEQSAGIEQVNKAVVQLDQITQQNAALVEEASASSQAMAHQASDLSAQVGKFRLDESLIESSAPSTAAQKTTALSGPQDPAPAQTPRLKVVGGGGSSDF